MSAIISLCGRYRYRLERDIQPTGPVVLLVGVNHSTADATNNDPTIRKELGFGRRLGWRKIIKGNVFAYRATDVGGLAHALDPIGPDNSEHLIAMVADADLIIPVGMKQLRIQIALDDFGTGYSNLMNISNLEPDIVKLDRGFTLKALSRSYEYQLMQYVIEMVHKAKSVCLRGRC